MERTLLPHIVWPGPSSEYLLSRLAKFVMREYPTEADNHFQLARDLEEQIRNVIRANDRMTAIDNELYFLGDVKELVVTFMIRNKNEEMFPNMLLGMYGLPELSENAVNDLFNIIVDTMEYFLKKRLSLDVTEDWTTQKAVISGRKGKHPVMKDFEKSQLGIFLYLLYMRDLFRENPDVCIIISNLQPLVKQVRKLEEELSKSSRDAFIAAHPKYEADYDLLKEIFNGESVAAFRIYLLYVVLGVSGPFLKIERDERSGAVEANISNAFKVLMRRCGAKNARYTVTLLLLMDLNGAHANIVIIDRDNKTIERYEPNGYIASSGFGRAPPSIFGDMAEKADEVLYKLAREMNYSYQPPYLFCPKLGIQSIEAFFEKSTGYCVSWSILYGIERIETGLTSDDIARNFLDILVDRYALDGRTLAEKSRSVEKLIQRKVDAIFNEMDELYIELSQELGVRLSYEQGRLVYFE